MADATSLATSPEPLTHCWRAAARCTPKHKHAAAARCAVAAAADVDAAVVGGVQLERKLFDVKADPHRRAVLRAHNRETYREPRSKRPHVRSDAIGTLPSGLGT